MEDEKNEGDSDSDRESDSEMDNTLFLGWSNLQSDPLN